jgi:hypothetical protein
MSEEEQTVDSAILEGFGGGARFLGDVCADYRAACYQEVQSEELNRWLAAMQDEIDKAQLIEAYAKEVRRLKEKAQQDAFDQWDRVHDRWNECSADELREMLAKLPNETPSPLLEGPKLPTRWQKILSAIRRAGRAPR